MLPLLEIAAIFTALGTVGVGLYYLCSIAAEGDWDHWLLIGTGLVILLAGLLAG